MRVSEHYNLDRTQPTLDFVDVDVVGDTRVYVNPRSLLLLRSPWADECVSLIQSFFRTVLRAIREGNHDRARRLLQTLGEPNETHLGVSQGTAQGRGLGNKLAKDVWEALSTSEAVESGLLQDLEDSVLMVEGIGDDIVSDITTNIIREPLIEYTQLACEYYGIPTQPDIDSGPLWDAGQHEWYSEYVVLPTVEQKKLLLVPKAIVRLKMDYDRDEYYRDYLLNHLRTLELSANTELVQLLRNGQRRVTKKALAEKYGSRKSDIVRETSRHPEVLERYRRDRMRDIKPPLSHRNLAETEGTQPPDWSVLLQAVKEIKPGNASSSKFEDAVEQLLTALFYPSLTSPRVQYEIHEGRKRIDITYTNAASVGFFLWLATNYAAPHIFVECKNYGREVGNPELDQLTSRFSPSRGQVGLLVCRSFEKKSLFQSRCRDTALDQRGFVIPLDDSDLTELVRTRNSDEFDSEFALLKERFDRLIM